MTTETHSPQEPNEPNEFGFAGDPTGPSPDRTADTGERDGEDIAVPAGDITGAVSEAIEERTTRD